MNIEEFKEKYVDDEYYEVDGEGCDCVQEGDWEINHKTQYRTDVYQVGDEYFEVTFSQSNSGYWSDGERYEPEYRKVVPQKRVIEVTDWIAAER